MGHKAGWLALGAGIAGGADVILIPEIPYNVEKVAEAILEPQPQRARLQHRRRGRRGRCLRKRAASGRRGQEESKGKKKKEAEASGCD